MNICTRHRSPPRPIAIERRCFNAISIWLPFLDTNTRMPRLTRIAVPPVVFPRSVGATIIYDRRRVTFFKSGKVLDESTTLGHDWSSTRGNRPMRFIWGWTGGFEQLRLSWRVRVTHVGNHVARKLRFPATKKCNVTVLPRFLRVCVCVTCKLPFSIFVRHF